MSYYDTWDVIETEIKSLSLRNIHEIRTEYFSSEIRIAYEMHISPRAYVAIVNNESWQMVFSPGDPETIANDYRTRSGPIFIGEALGLKVYVNEELEPAEDMFSCIVHLVEFRESKQHSRKLRVVKMLSPVIVEDHKYVPQTTA